MKRKPERFDMRVTKGALIPADGYTQSRLREKGYNNNDIVSVQITKARNPGFNRKAHILGRLCAENIEGFPADSHKALKRLQLESNAACDEIALNFPGVGPCSYRVPSSLSFDSLDEAAFYAVYREICEHIAKTYWPNLDAEAVAEMAELMPEAV